MADVFEQDADSFARTLTLEMGKPIAQARNEVAKCVGVLRYYAQHAAAMLADEPVTTTAANPGSYLKYQPIGPVLAVMPWNFPLWQVIRFATPTFMVGNVALLKHASNVPQAALNIEDAAIAGNAIKKTVLELGGADPFIVMPSADLERAIEIGVWARIQNNGQSCIAAKRFIIHEAIADEYFERYAEAMSKLVVGDPLDEATQVGPLATAQGRDEVNEQVQD